MSNAAGRVQSGQTSARPMFVGLYGVSGSGKTFLLNELTKSLQQDGFKFYEGSEVIGSVVPGGLAAFQRMEKQNQTTWRELAIDKIKSECAESGYVGLVAGHFMLWSEEDGAAYPVYTTNDLNTFTHILYLDVPADRVVQQRQNDVQKQRPTLSQDLIHKWQLAEQIELRQICREYGILLFLIPFPDYSTASKLSNLLIHLRQDTTEQNQRLAEARLDHVVDNNGQKLETMCVLDADKTLSAEDTGTMFWKLVSDGQGLSSVNNRCPLQELFSSALGYSEVAFRQARLLYEEMGSEENFEKICEDVACSIIVHPQFVSFLRLVAEHNHINAVVLTCGVQIIWEKVLARYGLADDVKVIGGGRVADGLVITANTKASLVARLRDVHHLYIWAFGDSVLDIPMLIEAHQAIVVVGEEHKRSQSMDHALMTAIESQNFKPSQLLLPAGVTPRLDSAMLPLIQLTDHKLLDSIFYRRHDRILEDVHHNVARLLTTPMRDARKSGSNLRQAHGHVGWYLGMTFIPDIMGIDEHAILHVQGHNSTGHRLRDEERMLIVALMRGGEPMAFGVSDAFPMAMFIHAAKPSDIKATHLHGQRAVLLVDSVVNSGKTVNEFVEHIRKVHSTIKIVVIAGVVQAQHNFVPDANLELVALRRSSNKFTGKGTTDTGNRLFNTTHLD